jgi:hypothetical protein
VTTLEGLDPEWAKLVLEVWRGGRNPIVLAIPPRQIGYLALPQRRPILDAWGGGPTIAELDAQGGLVPLSCPLVPVAEQASEPSLLGRLGRRATNQVHPMDDSTMMDMVHSGVKTPPGTPSLRNASLIETAFSSARDHMLRYSGRRAWAIDGASIQSFSWRLATLFLGDRDLLYVQDPQGWTMDARVALNRYCALGDSRTAKVLIGLSQGTAAQHLSKWPVADDAYRWARFQRNQELPENALLDAPVFRSALRPPLRGVEARRWVAGQWHPHIPRTECVPGSRGDECQICADVPEEHKMADWWERWGTASTLSTAPELGSVPAKLAREQWGNGAGKSASMPRAL